MPNSIVKQAKLHYPEYRDLSDDELTLRYAREFPEYLKTPDFKLDYDRITRPQAPVVQPKPEAGIIESFGRRTAGGYQALGGSLWKGSEYVARAIGADEAAEEYRQNYEYAKAYADRQRAKSAKTGIAGFSGMVGEAVPSLLPVIATAGAGLPAAVAASGLTGGLSTLGTAEDAYKARYLREGMSEEEASSKARTSALLPATLSGITTAVVTRAFGATGVEAISGLRSTATAAATAEARQITLAEARKVLATKFIPAAATGAVKEIAEESVDQAAQSVIEKMSFNPELTFAQAIENVMMAGAVGGVLGGGVTAAMRPATVSGAREVVAADVAERQAAAVVEESKQAAIRAKLQREFDESGEISTEDMAALQADVEARGEAEAVESRRLTEERRSARIEAINQRERDLRAREQGNLTDVEISQTYADLAGAPKTQQEFVADAAVYGETPKAPSQGRASAEVSDALAKVKASVVAEAKAAGSPTILPPSAPLIAEADTQATSKPAPVLEGLFNIKEAAPAQPLLTAEGTPMTPTPFEVDVEKVMHGYKALMSATDLPTVTQIDSFLNQFPANVVQEALGRVIKQSKADVSSKRPATTEGVLPKPVAEFPVSKDIVQASPAPQIRVDVPQLLTQQEVTGFRTNAPGVEVLPEANRPQATPLTSRGTWTGQEAVAPAKPVAQEPVRVEPLPKGKKLFANERAELRYLNELIKAGKAIPTDLATKYYYHTKIPKAYGRIRHAPSDGTSAAELRNPEAEVRATLMALMRLLGVTKLPANIKVIWDENGEFAGQYNKDTGEIIINAAQTSNPEATLMEEALHAVWDDPEVQAAWQAVKDTVTGQDVKAQAKRHAVMGTTDEAILMEEAAVAKVVNSSDGVVARLLNAIRRALRKLLGVHMPLRSMGEVRQAAIKKLLSGVGKPESQARGASGRPAFYSRLNRTVEQSQQNKASGAQWKATIKNSKLGTNADEYALVGVGDLEDGKTYTKQEVLDYLKANEVVVKDVTLGAEGSMSEEMEDAMGGGGQRMPSTPEEWMAESAKFETLAQRVQKNGFTEMADRYFRLSEEANRLAEGLGKDGSTQGRPHFSDRVLPGAKEGSYREVLLTVPQGSKARELALDVIAKREDAIKSLERNDFLGFDNANEALDAVLTHPDWAGRWDVRGSEDVVPIEEFVKAKKKLSSTNWRDGHDPYSSIPNPIVRLRLNERTTADGKRMLFLEEVQAPQKGEFDKMPALFQKNWREIALKWALRHAAENGFDSVGWTTGEQQAARGDLIKQVSRIEVRKVPGSTQVYLAAYDYAPGSDRREYGRRVIDKMVNPGELESYIGKELAAKVEAMEWTPYDHETPQGETITQDHKVLSGLDLKVGGEGLKKLYDTDFRNVVNSLPAVKKAGQKVGTSNIGLVGNVVNYTDGSGTFGREGEATLYRVKEYGDEWRVQEKAAPGEPWIQNTTSFKTRGEATDSVLQPRPDKIHSITLTPAIRESVMGGQARYAPPSRTQGSPPLSQTVNGEELLSWADKLKKGLWAGFHPLTALHHKLAKSIKGYEVTTRLAAAFENLAGVAGIAKKNSIEFRLEMQPLIEGMESDFNEYLFWQYAAQRTGHIEAAKAKIVRLKQLLAVSEPGSGDMMRINLAIESQEAIANKYRFGKHTYANSMRKLGQLKAKLTAEGNLARADAAVDAYGRHTTKALTAQLESGYISQKMFDNYRKQSPIFYPMVQTGVAEGRTDYSVSRGIVGIDNPKFKIEKPMDAADIYIYGSHVKAEANKAKLYLYHLARKANNPNAARAVPPDGERFITEPAVELRLNGQPVFVVADPAVVECVALSTKASLGALESLLSKASSALRFGATTASMAFQIKNFLLSDFPTLALMSKAGITNPANAIDFAIKAVTSFAHAFRANILHDYSPEYLAFMESGAMGTSLHSAIEGMGERGKPSDSKGLIASLVDYMGAISQTVEQTPKIAGFRILLKRAGVNSLSQLSPAERVALVSEVRNYCGSPDFARTGSVIKQMRAELLFVFLRAGIAGQSSSLERLTGNLSDMSTKGERGAAAVAQIRAGFLVGLAAYAAYALNHMTDELREDYELVPDIAKNDAFYIPTDEYDTTADGGKVRRYIVIPKRGFIKLIANPIESYMTYTKSKSPEAFSEMLVKIGENMLPLDVKGKNAEERIMGVASSLNPAIRVPIEYATGFTFYSRSRTVPRRLESASVDRQYTERTNENVKSIATLLGVSPLKLEQVMTSVTGGLTRSAFPRKGIEGSEESPSSVPIIKNFISPPYRESADEDMIDRLLTEAANVSVDRMRKATQFVDSREGMDVEAIYREAIDKLGVQNRDVVEKVRELLIQKRSGVTREERRITQLPPKQRAELILHRYARTNPQDRDNLIRSLINKRVITRDTAMYMEAAGFKYQW